MLVTANRIPDDELTEIISEALAHSPVGQGGNSSIHRVHWGERPVAVKDYRARSDFERRASREWNGLMLLWSAGLRLAPEPIAASLGSGLVIMEWIDSSQDSHSLGAAEAVALLAGVRCAEETSLAAALGPAADAIREPSDLLQQVHDRIEQLHRTELFRDVPDAQDVIVSIDQARKALAIQPAPPGPPIRILSPSDFGQHNVIPSSDGMRIIDLEFFGWDDAHKLVADTILHPMNSWSDTERSTFIELTSDLYGLDPQRLHSVIQFCALKWATIILARAGRHLALGDSEGYISTVRRSREYVNRGLDLGVGL